MRSIFMFSLRSSLVTLSLSLECMSSRSHSIAWYILFLVFWAGREFLFWYLLCQYVLLIHSSAAAAAGDSEAGGELHNLEGRKLGRGEAWNGGGRQTDILKDGLGWLACLLLHLSLGRWLPSAAVGFRYHVYTMPYFGLGHHCGVVDWWLVWVMLLAHLHCPGFKLLDEEVS